MYRLFTLGAVTLLPPTENGASALLSSRKPLALLAYLASAHCRYTTRDLLIGLFWPESDHSHARSSLNQSLHLIRQSLGADALEVRGGEEIGIAAEAVWCDVPAFRRSLKRGRYAEALELYRGDLLSGFFIRGADGFEHWLETERTALRREAAAAAWAIAGEGGSSDGDGPVMPAITSSWRVGRLVKPARDAPGR
jgi:serine/threonine-protein kinase